MMIADFLKFLSNNRLNSVIQIVQDHTDIIYIYETKSTKL